ncbi:protein encoded within IS [Shigella boydii]|nr:protein encoded within IS [Shigella boydii]
MNQKYLIRIAELECQLRQKDQQLSLVEETEAFLRSALARAEEKIEEDEREIEHLRAQIEKLRRMLFGTRSENCVVKFRSRACRPCLQTSRRSFSERVPNSIRRSFSI